MPRRQAEPEPVHGIVADLVPLAVPLEWITPLDRNPRRGKVEQIAKSYERFGQRKPIVVNRTGTEEGHPVGFTEAGNHQYVGAQKLGWTHIAVVWVDDDEATAKAFSLADNQLHDIGEYDTPLLAEFVADVIEANPDGGVDLLLDSGFDADGLASLIQTAQATPDPLEGPESDDPGLSGGDGADDPLGGAPGIGLGTPVIATNIVFDTEDQQRDWYRFVRHLRVEYPDCDTTGERLAAYITANIPAED